MAHIRSHLNGADESHNTFLVIFKVHGDAIQLWPRDKMQSIGKTHTFRVSCHDVETHTEHPGADIQVITIAEPALEVDNCVFQEQHPLGEQISPADIAIFMTGPVVSTRNASYAMDLCVTTKRSASSIKESTISESSSYGSTTDDEENGDQDDFEKLGSAYLYLDPKFSSQGVQRTPIIASHNHKPIGQMQVEYLIVTNPVAYGKAAPKPEWLMKGTQLIAGHRGAGSGRRLDLPERLLENTVASFNYAHRHGADMCELDVLISADGVPVVYHDFDVDAVAAQESSDELGKLRVQVNEFTVKQLRDFRLLALHDGKGCPYTLNVPNQEESNRPFPTLAEVLEQVDESCGLNIEIKWPQLLESGRMEARRCREINDFVDRIINVVDQYANHRRIILESFDADLVIMLRMKQNRFPVIFLTQAQTDRYERYVDVRARSVRNGIYFSQAFDLAGIDLIAEYYIASGKKLVDLINSHGLVARAWGDIDCETLGFLREIGLQCITYDKIDLVKQQVDKQQQQQQQAQQQQQQQQVQPIPLPQSLAQQLLA